MLPKWAWSGSRQQFLHCGLRKFCHSKSSVYRWYTQLNCCRFVYDTWDNGSRLGRVMVECTLSITHCLWLNLQLHTIDLVRICRISSFYTVGWQLARFQLTRRIARSIGDSSASCTEARDSEWQRHQLGHMQDYTSLPRDNHASTPPLSFFTGWMPFLPPNQQRQSTNTYKQNLMDKYVIILCLKIYSADILKYPWLSIAFENLVQS